MAGSLSSSISWAIRPARRSVAASSVSAEPRNAKDVKPGDMIKDCPDCPQMVVVPAGDFIMGSTAAEEEREGDEGPAHRVTFANPLAATASLTLLAGCGLVATGALRLIVAFQNRELPYWGWVAFSGLLSVVLCGMIIAQWPASSLWVLGTFLAIEHLFA